MTAVQIELERLVKLLRICGLRLFALHDVAQPAELFVEVGIDHAVLFVLPMRRDTVFRYLVHLECAYLYLKRHAVSGHYRSMQRLIVVGLGHGDIVLEPSRDRLPHRVYHAEHLVTVSHVLNDYAHRRKVVDLLEGLVLIDHLFVDAVKMLRSAADLTVDTEVLERVAYLLAYLVDKVLPLRAL